MLEMVSNYGIGLIIVALFIYDWLTNKNKINETLRQNEKCLEELSLSSKNTAKSLELLQQTMDDEKQLLLNHDKRCEKTQYMVEDVKKMMEKIGGI